MISVYPFGDELYALTEYPVIHRFDPITLDTLDKVSEYILNHAKQTQTLGDTRHFSTQIIIIFFF
jgi:carotenoid isomerooxygenase